MAHIDFRDYLATLEAHGKLKRVLKSVDKRWEFPMNTRQGIGWSA